MNVKKNISKFFIYTRGRTGSTPICDELDNHPNIICHQELFMPDAWHLGGMYEAYQEHGEVIFQEKGTDYKVLPFSLYLKSYDEVHKNGRHLFCKQGKVKTRSEVLDDYFDLFEEKWISDETTHVGFKILSEHFIAWPELWSALNIRGYQALYLSRNPVLRVLSGMLAAQRGGGGAYNEKGGSSFAGKIKLDANTFRTKLNDEGFCDNTEKKDLFDQGIKYMPINYEFFMDSRDSFYQEVFEFLECAVSIPDCSNYTVQIQRPLSEVIDNYDEIKMVSESLGVKYLS